MANVFDFEREKFAREQFLIVLAGAIESTFDGQFGGISFDLIKLADELRLLPDDELRHDYEICLSRLAHIAGDGHDTALRLAHAILDIAQTGLADRLRRQA